MAGCWAIGTGDVVEMVGLKSRIGKGRLASARFYFVTTGIYVDAGNVIHFTWGESQETGTGTVLDRFIGCLPQRRPLDNPCSICDDQSKARGGTCTLASSEPPEQVIHRAFYFLRKGFGVYDVMKNNCEDFALCCKTGLQVIPTVSVGQSGQAASFQAAAGVILSSSLVFLTRSSPLGFLATNVTGLAGIYGKYCVNRLVNDIGVRQDVRRVVLEEET
nr:hypothetical protein CFP56_21462 [Quercus suber]